MLSTGLGGLPNFNPNFNFAHVCMYVLLFSEYRTYDLYTLLYDAVLLATTVGPLASS